MRRQMQAGGFGAGCVFEMALLGVAALLGWLVHQPPWTTLRWDLRHALLGAAAALPPWLCYLWLMKTDQVLAQTRGFLRKTVRPWLAHWSLAHLAMISLLAGVCEEALFRGVIQSKLVTQIGLPLGLVSASLLFGAAHWINLEYLLLATASGIYFGGLMWVTDNLMTPVVTHAVYDFLALAYLVRWGPCPEGRGSTAENAE